VNSGGELAKALRAGFAPGQIVFNGVAKTEAEITAAVEAGIRSLIIDSLFEVERTAGVAAALARRVDVALRIDVDVRTHTHPGLATTHGGKAGIDLDDALPAFARAAAAEWLDVRGLHLHIGSQITSVEPYVRALATSLDLVQRLEDEAGLRLEQLNIGGGLAVPYRDKPACAADDYFCCTLTPDDYAAAICTVLERRRPDLRLFLEPGRAIAGTTAILVTRVEGEKTKGVRDESGRRTSEERWLVIDAGANTLLEHTNYDWYFRSVVANKADRAATAPFRLAGPLCDGGDVFVGDDGSAFRRFPAETTVGDVVVFRDCGAYTLEMMYPYNARPCAAAYAVVNGEVVQIRRAESFDDLVAGDIAEGAPLFGRSARPR
jgi:diaminopimelate decarboxylase